MQLLNAVCRCVEMAMEKEAWRTAAAEAPELAVATSVNGPFVAPNAAADDRLRVEGGANGGSRKAGCQPALDWSRPSRETPCGLDQCSRTPGRAILLLACRPPALFKSRFLRVSIARSP